MVLTTAGKNWLAINAGVGNCFASSGVTYADPDGFMHTEWTSQVVNAFYTAGTIGKENAIIIAGTNYTGFIAINGGNLLDLADVTWAFNNDGLHNSDGHVGVQQYCVPPAHIVSTVLNVNSACSPDPCTVDATITWMNDGGLSGTFTPGVIVDGGTPQTIPIESLASGVSVSHVFTISGLDAAGSPHTICATPGPLCQNVSSFATLDICNWIISKGGWTAITAYDIMILVNAYLNLVPTGFTVTMAHILGAISYYLGIPDSGNAFTTCVF